MEIPLVPLLVGGVIIMTIISYMEDRLKDENKETVKHWKKDSPLRQLFKTAVELKTGKDVSNEIYNKKIRKFHEQVKTFAEIAAQGALKGNKTDIQKTLGKLEKDMKGIKTKKDLKTLFEEYEEILNTYDELSVGHFKLGKGNPEGILKKSKTYKPNLDTPSLDGGRSKRRTKKKNTKKKSRKRSQRRTRTRRR